MIKEIERIGLRMLRRTLLISSGIVLVGLFAAAPVEARKGALVVVTAKSSPIDDITLTQLRQIYLGASMHAEDGSRIIALNRGNKTKERIDFDQSVLRMSPVKVARYWIDRRIRGKSGSPKAIDPAPLLQKVVKRLPSAITYVRSSQVGAGMKIVRVDGKSSDDPGYPIRP